MKPPKEQLPVAMRAPDRDPDEERVERSVGRLRAAMVEVSATPSARLGDVLERVEQQLQDLPELPDLPTGLAEEDWTPPPREP